MVLDKIQRFWDLYSIDSIDSIDSLEARALGDQYGSQKSIFKNF